MTRVPPSVPKAWTRNAIGGGAIYFVLFAIAVSLFETAGRLIAVPVFDGAPDFDIQVLILIVIAWAAAIIAASANRVPDRAAPRLVMGGIGFGLLILAEAYVSLVIENQSPVKVAQAFGSFTGILRLLSYAAFGLAPLLQIWIRWQEPQQHGAGVNSLHP
ncbi:MAG TPA: hypothetical protein VG407_08815 [Caulobacteraceae bacterium]|jgi:hypothetical protein|nr:hypothetical protein [Caulobacteraceae bacterium]